MTKFNENDKVIVAGITTDRKGTRITNTTICKVVSVGKYDLFVKKIPEASYEKAFSIPQSMCQKIEFKKFNTEKSIQEPKIGNLVISVFSKFSNEEKVVGRIEKIVNKPGSKQTANLRVTTELVEVPFDSLIILEE